MLKSLIITNYALIDLLSIDFTPGLNIITGETGAGKSIMLGALGLLLGARADGRVVRSAERKSVVEAIYDVTGLEVAAKWAADNDIDWDDECFIRRELLPSGRSRAFINDTPVTIAQLSQIGEMLVDIHSQNQNLLLTQPEFQLQVIDSIADNAVFLLKYKAKYKQFRDAEKKLYDTRKAIEQNKADEEFIRFRLAQLEEAQLQSGEQETLESERDLQANMAQIKEMLQSSLDALTLSDSSVLQQLNEATSSTASLSDYLEGASALAERLETARVEIQDIAETLSDYDSNLGGEPGALEAIEERLALIYALESRHHVETVEELIAIRDSLRSQLETIEDGDMALDDLANEAMAAKKEAIAAAKQLSSRRKASAAKFADELFAAASPLGMPNLRCEVAVAPSRTLLPTGADVVEFRFAFNKNQVPASISGIASGGEMSRLMLALKSIVSKRLNLPTIIFDEVDTGVSGDVANRMGGMMVDMAQHQQVITITHLPQVAAKGSSHYKVFKEDDLVSTHTRIRRLTDAEREGELALMLSGCASDEAALANARSLLNSK